MVIKNLDWQDSVIQLAPTSQRVLGYALLHPTYTGEATGHLGCGASDKLALGGDLHLIAANGVGLTIHLELLWRCSLQ
jgi:hypothetical protein